MFDWITKERTILMNKTARKFIKNALYDCSKSLCVDDKLINKFNREKIRLNNDELLVLKESLADVMYDYKDDEQKFIYDILNNLN